MKLATLVYVRRDGKTLMVQRGKKANDMHAGVWNGLGGKMEGDETAEQCAIRELEEETGLVATAVTEKGVLNFPANVEGSGEAWKVWVYEVTEFAGELRDDCPEGELEWVDDEKVLDLPLNEGDYIWMKWFYDNKHFDGTFVYDKKKLQDWSVVFS